MSTKNLKTITVTITMGEAMPVLQALAAADRSPDFDRADKERIRWFHERLGREWREIVEARRDSAEFAA